MKIQLDWLKEYVEFDLSAEELGHVLTMGGLEIECHEQVELADGTKTDVMEINVTPNRGYCLSYFGVAREVSALLGTPCKLPSPHVDLEKNWGNTPVEEKLSVENHDKKLCSRYSGMVIENVKPGPSPEWLADRLTAIGLRPINNIVDITNYVMMEYGQPLHAFDRELLAGSKIVIRRAKKNELFTRLDGTELKLDEDALMIADAEKPVALAGVMGGAHSQVTESTRNLVLESACFDPVTMRKGSRKYAIRTDSSIRFERGVDIDGVIVAQSRAALLIKELAGGTICKGRIDVYPTLQPVTRVVLRTSRLNQILGTELAASTIRGYLDRLRMDLVEETNGEEFAVDIPSFRPALSREIDLIEEVARVHSYEKVEVSHPVASVTPVGFSKKQTEVRRLKEIFSHLGFSEAVNYSFINSKHADLFKPLFGAGAANSKTIAMSNPLSSDMEIMRTSLLPGLLNTASLNVSKGQKPVKIFEIGGVFLRAGKEAVQKNSLAGLALGQYENNVWKEQGKGYDYYDIKGVLESALEQLKISLEYKSVSNPVLQEGKSVQCLACGRASGYLGELAASLVKEWDLNQKVYVFEMDVEALVDGCPSPIKFNPIPKYPETYRDISILIDKALPSQEVTDLIMKISAPLISRVELYDYFEGKKIEEGKKSLTYALIFQSSERTLTDEEVNPVFDKIVHGLSDKLGATLRK